MRNKLAPTDLTPTCVLCHKTNPEGVMIFLPLFKNRYKGYPIIGISWELARKEGLDSPLWTQTLEMLLPKLQVGAFFAKESALLSLVKHIPS